ncbi:hypothetical protein EFY79_05145 [Hanamia caeni]|uniref:Uncharacterized protein n=1 Tax=Hanamia caeni TaxID=2294116 RepID=A0A3M9NMM0_9BACT|nr:hypothetical protein EFY79_05145 [Hanamia caeni]
MFTQYSQSKNLCCCINVAGFFFHPDGVRRQLCWDIKIAYTVNEKIGIFFILIKTKKALPVCSN